MMLPFSPPAMRTPDGKPWSSMPCGPQTSLWYLETEEFGYYWDSKLTLTKVPEKSKIGFHQLAYNFIRNCKIKFFIQNFRYYIPSLT